MGCISVYAILEVALNGERSSIRRSSKFDSALKDLRHIG